METLKPIIKTEEPDKSGRTIKVGIQHGLVSSYFPAMSIKEVSNLRDTLNEFLRLIQTGLPTPSVQPFPSKREVLQYVKVGDTVKVRFEEFGVPDKHIPGRVTQPKRIYRLIKVTDKRGDNFTGKDVATSCLYKFNIEQILNIL